MKIGVAISVHNRHTTAAICVAGWKKYMPEGGKLVIIDDASTPPFPQSTYRFKENVGIPRAKNMGLHLLEDCDHIFLADDDTWPITAEWWKPYVQSNQPHLMFTFDHLRGGRPNGNKKVIAKNGLVSYSNPCGCLLYFERRVLDVVGGFDVNFTKYFFEHVELSRRIYNAGLTSAPFQDIPNSLELFHSMDWACEVKSSVQENRSLLLRQNKKYYDSQLNSKEFKPYKQYPNFLLSCMFTTLVDPQRGETWPTDFTSYKLLLESTQGVAMTRFFTDAPSYEHKHPGNSDWYYVKPGHNNPYFARWFAYRDYLRHIDPHCLVWCTDLTDVTMLRNPYPHMKRGFLYTGDEQGQHTGSVWLRRHHINPKFNRLYSARLPLLNAGLLGGEAGIVLDFCEKICHLADLTGQWTDMAAFNQVAYEFFHEKLHHGPAVNTVFKTFKDNGVAWWMHK